MGGGRAYSGHYMVLSYIVHVRYSKNSFRNYDLVAHNCDGIGEKDPLRTELQFPLWAQIVTHAQQCKSQITNMRISAMEAATDTKQSAIGSSRAVL